MPQPVAMLSSNDTRVFLASRVARWTAVEGYRLVVGLHDEVDVDVLPLAVAAAAGEDYEAVVFDLAAVGCFDTTLLSAILRCEAGLAVSGVEVRLRNASALARRTLAITSLSALLE